MKTTRNVSRFLALILALCLMVTLAAPAMAAGNDAVTDAKTAVMQVQLWFSDPEHLTWEYHLQNGTGFLINENTLITNEHVVNYKDNSEIATHWALYIKELTGLTYNPEEVMRHMRIRVAVLRDVYVEASIVTSSWDMDYAVLRLEQDIRNRTTLPIRSSSTLRQTESVYALGYPGDYEDINDQTYYNGDDVVITTGTVNNVGRSSFDCNLETVLGSFTRRYENVDFVEHSAKIVDGNSGGPLVDENGAVVGINAAGSDVRNLAVASDELTATLDALGIDYVKADGAPVPETTVPETTAPETTVAPVPETTAAPVPETTAAPTPTETAADPVPAPADNGSNITIILIVAAVAILAVVIVVVVVVSKNKNSSATSGGSASYQGGSNGGFQQVNHTVATNTTNTNTSGETTVLNNAVGETTVLTRNGGTLIRKKTGETVKINVDHFVIGREPKTANYCITDNSSISRSHVTLTIRNGVTYLTDMKAANGTFVNGVKVVPNQEIALKNGDKITLSDEDFEFRI